MAEKVIKENETDLNKITDEVLNKIRKRTKERSKDFLCVCIFVLAFIGLLSLINLAVGLFDHTLNQETAYSDTIIGISPDEYCDRLGKKLGIKFDGAGIEGDYAIICGSHEGDDYIFELRNAGTYVNIDEAQSLSKSYTDKNYAYYVVNDSICKFSQQDLDFLRKDGFRAIVDQEGVPHIYGEPNRIQDLMNICTGHNSSIAQQKPQCCSKDKGVQVCADCDGDWNLSSIKVTR